MPRAQAGVSSRHGGPAFPRHGFGWICGVKYVYLWLFSRSRILFSKTLLVLTGRTGVGDRSVSAGGGEGNVGTTLKRVQPSRWKCGMPLLTLTRLAHVTGKFRCPRRTLGGGWKTLWTTNRNLSRLLRPHINETLDVAELCPGPALLRFCRPRPPLVDLGFKAAMGKCLMIFADCVIRRMSTAFFEEIQSWGNIPGQSFPQAPVEFDEMNMASKTVSGRGRGCGERAKRHNDRTPIATSELLHLIEGEPRLDGCLGEELLQ